MPEDMFHLSFARDTYWRIFSACVLRLSVNKTLSKHSSTHLPTNRLQMYVAHISQRIVNCWQTFLGGKCSKSSSQLLSEHILREARPESGSNYSWQVWTRHFIQICLEGMCKKNWCTYVSEIPTPKGIFSWELFPRVCWLYRTTKHVRSFLKLVLKRSPNRLISENFGNRRHMTGFEICLRDNPHKIPLNFVSKIPSKMMCPKSFWDQNIMTCNVMNLKMLHVFVHNSKYMYIHTYIHTYLPTYIHTDRQTERHTYIHTCIHTYIHTYIHIFSYWRYLWCCSNVCTYMHM